jgi:hypothetical protein
MGIKQLFYCMRSWVGVGMHIMIPMTKRLAYLLFSKTTFQSLCVGLLQKCTPNGPTHKNKIDKLWRWFPKTQQWLDSWNSANVSETIFPSHGKIIDNSLEEEDSGLPNTTNAQESMHCLYYMIRLVLWSISLPLSQRKMIVLVLLIYPM